MLIIGIVMYCVLSLFICYIVMTSIILVNCYLDRRSLLFQRCIKLSVPTPPHTSPPKTATQFTSAPAGCRTVCSHVRESTSHTRTSHSMTDLFPEDPLMSFDPLAARHAGFCPEAPTSYASTIATAAHVPGCSHPPTL